MTADAVHFGTDGWRAIIDEDFNLSTVVQVADAAARAFWARVTAGLDAGGAPAVAAQLAALAASPLPAPSADFRPEIHAPVIYIGYDCRRDAGRDAAVAGFVLQKHGFDVRLSDRYCPTPALCWTIARDEWAIGGLMLTSSHNPAEWLGIKLRMADGGASPASFTNEVEALLEEADPTLLQGAELTFGAAANGTPQAPVTRIGFPGTLTLVDLMTPYLADLASLVDAPTIAAAGLRVVLDPMYGAGRGYLAGVLHSLGVTVAEVHGQTDPSFAGLHPEPILPWVQGGADKVVELGFDACFVTDGDADRIGAIDEHGRYITSHIILTLLIGHLVESKGLRGRVVRTMAGSNLLRRQCQRLDLELVTKPIGFKWIYEEMLAGDVLIGGEESGGIGIPAHVRERDGLLMALLLCELMATKRQTLGQLADEVLVLLGNLDYARRDLRLTPEQKQRFLVEHTQTDQMPGENISLLSQYSGLFAPLGEQLVGVSRIDGIKFELASDAWLLVRPSGTEPLVRVYAEAGSRQQVEQLLDVGCALAEG
ncbi:MAG: phosphoglucomutase/phosphomannomutase family protein [Coriobacteriales bacterium]|jgi:phosphomannomutase|nr:phosphoglucomutase/phosphomannomutase family protein [Coriobacteriales bacterium]